MKSYNEMIRLMIHYSRVVLVPNFSGGWF